MRSFELTSLAHVIEEIFKDLKNMRLFFRQEFCTNTENKSAEIHGVNIVADASALETQLHQILLDLWRNEEINLDYLLADWLTFEESMK